MQPQIAFSKQFLESYSQLPKTQQKKVREFTEKFRVDPTQSGINFEKIQGAADPKVRSVRIDQAYRAIVVHPPKGDVYLCMWVDHHDDAYAWAQNKRFEVNPRSGAFQLWNEEEVQKVPEEKEEAHFELPGLFDGRDDEELLMAGVPRPLLPAIRALHWEQDLDRLAPHLPEDVAETLYRFAAGYTLDEVLTATERVAPTPEETADTEDFKEALDHPDSKRTFKVVESEDDLQEMLDAPLEQWRVFLHPTQRDVVEMEANGPIRVLGGAGTGKTVALMHRARYLAEEVFTEPDDLFLVTTFTRNLALDLEVQIRELCTPDAFERIEVRSLHSWAAGYLRNHGLEFDIETNLFRRRRLMESSMEEEGFTDFDAGYLMDEWDLVVQGLDIADRDEYLTVPRTGRGLPMGRRQRHFAWQVFERYRQKLDDREVKEWPDVIRRTREVLAEEGLERPYRSVLADEVQDFDRGELLLLRDLAPSDQPNNLFLVGDAHQRIYGIPIPMSQCGIEIRGRSRRLKLNYRTTAEIRHHAVAVLEDWEIDDLDGGLDDLKGYSSIRRGPTPEVLHFSRESKEAEALLERVRSWLEEVPAETICIAARTSDQIKKRYQPLLEAEGIATYVVQNEPEAGGDHGGVRLATMHRMKGLEFNKVALAGVHQGMMPLERGDLDETDELKERCLFYVACTRARDELLITGFGEKSPFLVASAH